MVASLAQLLDLMTHHGATRIYAKRLSANDNSKQQVYLGGGFAALNIIPHGEIVIDTSERAGSKQDRPKAPLSFFWIDENGRHPAPGANLILYPDYPEVRLSGFLRGCAAAPNGVMTVRREARVLVLGMTPGGEVLAHALAADSPVAAEVLAHPSNTIGVFLELPLSLTQESPKAILLRELRRIWRMQWIASQKLAADGSKVPYAARNGGGYTLEAELGITPNGYAEPDFMGWEVKQYGVSDFIKFRPKSPVTLMTPEPTGGVYRAAGVAEFMRRFGYPDQSGKPDRFNFGGRYDCQTGHHHLTGLRMSLAGYDAASGKITDIEGGFSLLTAADENAASWSFKGLMAHWNRKHAQAAYVPSLFRTPPPEYSYGAHVLLCEKTDFLLFLKAFAAGRVYYDPAVKVEGVSTAAPAIKRRSQFRVAHGDLTQLYERHEAAALD